MEEYLRGERLCTKASEAVDDKVLVSLGMAYIACPVNLDSPATFLSTGLIYSFEIDVAVFITFARLL